MTPEENKTVAVLDPLVIYSGYSDMRTSINELKFSKKMQLLEQNTKDMNTTEATVFVLAIYENITMDASKRERTAMDDNLREEFDSFLRNIKTFSPLMLQTARRFLVNAQGGSLAQMRITPGMSLLNKTLGAIVVHSVSVICRYISVPVMFPFALMLNSPADLANAYLPTMAEDILFEVRKAGGQFYTCPNGHPYHVGECGQPLQEAPCNICHYRIGGVNHRLREDNTNARVKDGTKTGHDLGDAGSRQAVAPERKLSRQAICIIRAIMHSVFLWCACHHEDSLVHIVSIVKPQVHPDHLPEFFWRHLQKDLEQLSATTGRNVDEAAIIVHLVLKDMLLKDPPRCVIDTLLAKNAREEWERIFNEHYIQPVVEKLNTMLNATIDQIASDKQQGHDQLFYIVYEKIKVDSESLEPHLWTYRQRVSLKHLAHTLQEKKFKEKYPILHEFLQMEPKLRATQYLPHLVKLQQCLYDRFNFCMDRKEAMNLSIADFLNHQLGNENSRNEYRHWIESLQKAWALVGQDLKTHGRMPVEDKHCLPAITMDTSLEYLIPTTTGAGICTTALVDFLTLTHNNFIEECRGIVASSSQRSGSERQLEWLKNDIPITHIQQCHLLDYEDQIIPVVLSHCHYSLKVGQASRVKYDHLALQKHILDKFIHGKPMILSDIPQVVYRTDVHTTSTFEAIRSKVEQERLEERVKIEILAELQSRPDVLRANLDIVDVVLGFLSSGGGKPNVLLKVYINRVLKMSKRPFTSKKAQEHCQLKHVLSLWETLSVELARLSWLRKEEPFDNVHEKYLKELAEDEKQKLDQCLHTFNLSRLLGALYEFIETGMRNFSTSNQLEWPLVTVLVEEKYKYLGLPKDFDDVFPDTITIAQIIAVWKHIVIYQESIKQN